jgi:hypothetical protein
MTSEALFGLSVMMSFLAFGIVTGLYIWPRLERVPPDDALAALAAPHMFRFVGLSFLISGVVSPTLSPEFAVPAAYGDLGATVLAVLTVLALSARLSWANPIVWVFNLWGSVDLLNALYQGAIGVGLGPGSLGAAYFIPTVMVPPWLVTHGLMFWLLLRPKRS